MRTQIKVFRTYYILLASAIAHGLPIYNGFSVKFSPILKDEIRPKTFVALFAKVPQEAPITRENLTLPDVGHLGAGCTNQIAKILFPTKTGDDNNMSNETSSDASFINIPILKQPVNNYRILIATAPRGVTIDKGDDSKPLLVYIVFPNDGGNNKNMRIPLVYFVDNARGFLDMETKQKLDPILIVDHNRTVTKLKSSGITKFVKFKSKLINHFNDHE